MLTQFRLREFKQVFAEVWLGHQRILVVTKKWRKYSLQLVKKTFKSLKRRDLTNL